MADENSVSRKLIVLYHQGCPDGWCALAIADQWLSRNPHRFTEIVYMPVLAGKTAFAVDQLIKENSPNTVIFSFDLSYFYGPAKKLLNYFPNARIYDHHTTTEDCFVKPMTESKEDFERQQEIFAGRLLYDKTISGAMLAWNCFYPHIPPPTLVKYIQDKDLYLFGLPNSREINAGLSETLTTSPSEDRNISKADATAYAVKEWSKYLLTDSWFETARLKGEVVISIMNRAIKRLYRGGSAHRIISFGKPYVAFVCNTGEYISELGEYIYSQTVYDPAVRAVENSAKKYKHDYAVMWRYDHTRNVVYVSLRTRKEHDVDLAKICAEFEWKTDDGETNRGGGHKAAAGFETSLQTFFQWIGPRIDRL